ncbi:MAG: arginine--tRNA ligase [Pseudodesulfovibrio sp.]|uniref:Arginine--tRNA ligase n=1 Tax=Pseudodesulfovibrio indicus TaxID=1716143 RepID=A0A140D995_9BACT|nr:arginine--tRNA ligase [Pseudodesulfovibrio indicus]AMK09762.1 arginine--tRNA ligase [Pseudodesulfovibrio indicus]TDT86277.1 arginyl-tRNA synthetase [Pseudodesulfovibrio indicus]
MRAKIHLEAALKGALDNFGWEWPEKAVIEPPRDKQFGDMSANVAMLLAKEAKKAPRAIAEDIQAALSGDPNIEKIDIAGPGFLNFTFSPSFWRETVSVIAGAGEGYGTSTMGNGTKVQVEYVSANPTGPLHIGHGRGAALGDSLTRILEKAGFDVEAEYYINDAGRQMLILGGSILYRARQLGGQNPAEPEDYYKGEYITEIAAELMKQRPDLLTLPEEEAVEVCKVYGKDDILEGIKADLAAFGVRHDVWFSEKSLVTDGKVDETFADLTASGMGYEADGAYWFRSTQLGDDKDRVLRKSNGDTTYFASDIAYHDNKFKRGFDLVVDIWGADHHGYVPRMMAACEALGKPGGLSVILVNLVNLLRDGQPIAMSTRAGQFETLKDVVDEVGSDAARFMFLSRKSDSKLDFDLELVKQKSMDNPVYYVQYAYARIRSLGRKAEETGVAPAAVSPASLALLDTEHDMEMLRLLDQYPDYVESAARTQSPHLISMYLQELASTLHRYYTNCHVLSAERDVAEARLMLLNCVAGVLRNGLGLLGVNAPDSM